MNSCDGDSEEASENSWEQLHNEAAPFKLDHVSYVPNPPNPIINKALPNTPDLKKYDWTTLEQLHYIHIAKLSIRCNTLPNSVIHFKGYKTEVKRCRTESNPFKYRYYRGGNDGGWFTLEERWVDPPIEKNIRRQTYLDIKLRPEFRQNIWKSSQWIEDLLSQIQKRLHIPTPRLRNIELPYDIKIVSGWDYESLRPCLWESHSKEIFRVQHEGNEPTDYTGEKKKPKHIRIYRKKDALHIEPYLQGRYLWRSPERKWFSLETVLIFLIVVYESNGFRYLNYNKLMRSPKCRDKADNYWEIFKKFGTRAATDAIAQYSGYKNNITRFLDVHPFDNVFRINLSMVIEEGLQAVAKRGTPLPDLLAEFQLHEILSNRKRRRILKDHLKAIVLKRQAQR